MLPLRINGVSMAWLLRWMRGAGRTIYPYLIDILPRCKSHSLANEDERGYLRLNHIRRKTHHSDGELRILLTFGGSDQAKMTEVVGNFWHRSTFLVNSGVLSKDHF